MLQLPMIGSFSASMCSTPSASWSSPVAASRAPRHLHLPITRREGVMLERLESSLDTFKTLTFKKGLNVLLAQKSPGATDRQTRNGVGKSSFVELVHFLLGGSAPATHFLCTEPRLAEASFSMRFDLAMQPVEVERSPAAAKSIVRSEEHTSE